MSGTRRRLGVRSLAAAVGVALFAMPLVGGVAMAEHGTRSLNLDPERENSDVGTKRLIKAVLSSAPDAGTSVQVFFEITGVNDVDGDTTASPDMSCTVAGGTVDDLATGKTNESTTCTVSYKGAVAGDDEIRGWIADTAPDMVEGPSATKEESKNATDVVTTLWFDGLSGSTRMNCGPETVTGSVGTTGDLFTCEVVRTSDGTGVAGVKIDGENLGGANDNDGAKAFPVDYDDACVTGASGQCKIALADTYEAGPADICFWADEDSDQGMHATNEWDGGRCDEGLSDSAANLNTTDVVSMAWKHNRSVALSAPAGAATYGARVVLTGTVVSADAACTEGARVKIGRTLMDGTKQDVTTATTGADGSYSVKVRADKGARYSATASGDELCNSATSRSARMLVRKKVGLSLSKSAVARGRSVRVRAVLGPCDGLAGQKVVLYRSTNGGQSYKRVAAKRTNDNCAAVFKQRVSKKVLFQARSPKQDASFVAGLSQAKLVTVKR
ncbi:hypothetical protein BH24ACT26_BH24ACT26_08300 [soil metagenome]